MPSPSSNAKGANSGNAAGEAADARTGAFVARFTDASVIATATLAIAVVRQLTSRPV